MYTIYPSICKKVFCKLFISIKHFTVDDCDVTKITFNIRHAIPNHLEVVKFPKFFQGYAQDSATFQLAMLFLDFQVKISTHNYVWITKSHWHTIFCFYDFEKKQGRNWTFRKLWWREEFFLVRIFPIAVVT